MYNGRLQRKLNKGCEIEKSGAQPLYGGIAQLGEHLLCKQGVNGSIPFISTTGLRIEPKKPMGL